MNIPTLSLEGGGNNNACAKDFTLTLALSLKGEGICDGNND